MPYASLTRTAAVALSALLCTAAVAQVPAATPVRTHIGFGIRIADQLGRGRYQDPHDDLLPDRANAGLVEGLVLLAHARTTYALGIGAVITTEAPLLALNGHVEWALLPTNALFLELGVGGVIGTPDAFPYYTRMAGGGNASIGLGAVLHVNALRIKPELMGTMQSLKGYYGNPHSPAAEEIGTALLVPFIGIGVRLEWGG